MKFCKSGILPYITISSEIATGEQLKNEQLLTSKYYRPISIADNGISFDLKYKDRIFEIFQRLYGNNEYQGTGIGLAIVKKIVENHNGIITPDSGSGKGATFDIYIPTDNNH